MEKSVDSVYKEQENNGFTKSAKSYLNLRSNKWLKPQGRKVLISKTKVICKKPVAGEKCFGFANYFMKNAKSFN